MFGKLANMAARKAEDENAGKKPSEEKIQELKKAQKGDRVIIKRDTWEGRGPLLPPPIESPRKDSRDRSGGNSRDGSPGGGRNAAAALFGGGKSSSKLGKLFGGGSGGNDSPSPRRGRDPPAAIPEDENCIGDVLDVKNPNMVRVQNKGTRKTGWYQQTELMVIPKRGLTKKKMGGVLSGEAIRTAIKWLMYIISDYSNWRCIISDQTLKKEFHVEGSGRRL
jgi:hypothetical protein